MKIFKKFLTSLLLLLGATLLFSACSDEPQNTAIVGVWSYVYTDNGWYGKNEVGITYTFTTKRKATCHMWVYKNGKKTSDDNFNFTYQFDGSVLTLKDSSKETVSYNVYINGNKLTMGGKTYTKQ